jgi:hypothetical protein
LNVGSEVRYLRTWLGSTKPFLVGVAVILIVLAAQKASKQRLSRHVTSRGTRPCEECDGLGRRLGPSPEGWDVYECPECRGLGRAA